MMPSDSEKQFRLCMSMMYASLWYFESRSIPPKERMRPSGSSVVECPDLYSFVPAHRRAHIKK